MQTETHRPGLAVLVGAGPGEADLLTRAGETWLRAAECVIYDRLVDSSLLSLAPATAERICAGKSPGEHSMPQEKINALLVEKVRQGKLVVRLKGGDPFLFGRGGEEIEALAAANLPFRIVPGVTAAVAAGAYAGISLTDRRKASSVAFVTGHEDPSKSSPSVNYRALAGVDTVVFYMGVAHLSQIAGNLIAAGTPAGTPVAVVENAATPRQRTITATLDRIAQQAAQANVQPPAVVIVGAVAATAETFNWYERLPLAGRCILVTRSRPQASRLAARLAEYGAEVIEAPAVEIAPPETWRMVDDALTRLGQFDWIVFTSPNGAESVRRRLGDLGRDARAFAGAKLAAVGGATADALAAGGLQADLVPADFTTQALGRSLAQVGVSGRRVLLVRSDIAPPDLRDILSSAGATVEEVTVYRTLRPAALPPQVQEALRAGRVDWITFTSTSTVENFLAMLPAELRDLRGVKLAAIGPVTADALRSADLSPAVVARPHTIDALVDAMVRNE